MKREAVSHTLLAKHLKELGLHFEREVHFHPERKWRWDFICWTKHGAIAIEIMGSTWSAGRHTRGRGYQADCDKANHGVKLGWKLLRFTTEDVMRGRAKAFLKGWLKERHDSTQPQGTGSAYSSKKAS